jgi:predicted regulator of Ras-like GTPase activity (Roadblock/LC7/MglB family)
MKDMILFPEDIEHLNVILNQLAKKANLLLAVLINKDGRLLTYQGSLDKIDTVSLAALVAGNSASTLAIAHLMGESEFSAMYHQGKERHIYIAVVDENTFLCLVFDERTNIDRVKVFARQFDRQIKKALFQVYDKTEDQIDLDLDVGGTSFDQQAGNAGFQTASTLLKPEHVSDPFHSQQQPTVQPAAGYTPATQQPASSQRQHPGNAEDDIFYVESPDGTISETLGEKPHDTNYLYLKKKKSEKR